MARQGGRINIFAGLAAKGWAEVEANLIHYKELEVIGSANSRRADYQAALQFIESGRIKVGPMVTDRFPLRSACEALDKVASGEGIKIAVLPGQGQAIAPTMDEEEYGLRGDKVV